MIGRLSLRAETPPTYHQVSFLIPRGGKNMEFKVNKTKDFTIMSNYHLREKNMSLKSKGLLSVMLSLPDDWDFSIAGLVAISLESETSIKNALKELKQFGYLEVIKLMPNESENGRIDYIYNIYEKPKQNNEKQDIENLPLENNRQLNTNNKELNNKNNNITTTTNINYSYNNRELNSSNSRNDLFTFIETNFGRTLSSLEYQEIVTWDDNDLTRYAIKEAVLNGKFTIGYIRGILHNYKQNNITSVQQAEMKQEEFNRQKALNQKKKEKKDPYAGVLHL